MFDLIVISAYFVVMLFVGWRVRRQTPDSYWLAGRKYGTNRITTSLVATIFGASSTIGIVGLGYTQGLTGAWWAMMGGLALIPLGLFLAARVRTQRVVTLPDILRNAYGPRVALIGGVVIAVAWCGVVAAQFVAGGRIIAVLFGVEFQWTLIAVAVVCICYTFLGGQLSVIKTDRWQFGLLIGSVFLLLSFLLFGGDQQALSWASLPAGALDFPVSEKFGWYELLVFYPLIVGLPYLTGPDIYSRVLSARSDKAARRATLLAAGVVVPLALLLAFLGVLIATRFPLLPAEDALPHALQTLMPSGLRGLVAAGFLAAIMSSADSCLISAATIFSRNVVDPASKKSAERQLYITRAAVIGLGLVAGGIALMQRGIIPSLLLGYTIFVGGLAVPTLASFWRKRLGITSSAGFWAVTAGGASAILGKVNDGIAIKALLTESGMEILATILGPKALSILPLFLSAFVLITVSRLSRRH
ncbi:MAG: sodium:solute symporter family protein [candidate division Zixibacteria bacterium]|nr:sodium:solute symporter family protein [candidate division Zixibacteria bacterium]